MKIHPVGAELFDAERRTTHRRTDMTNLRGNKRPTRCNRLVFLLENLLFAQHVSGTIMPIIRSSKVIQMVAACGTWRFDLQVVGLVWSCELCFRFAAQLLTRPTTCKPKHQVSQAATICIILDLLMMGIMVPEAC